MSDDHLREIETESKAIYEGRVVNLHLKQVKLPNGDTSQREVILHHGAVAIVPILDNGNIAFVRQFRLPAQQVLLEVPAGTLEPNENPDKAAVRELREEIGYRPKSLHRLGGIFVAPGYTSEYIHLYLAEQLEKAPLATDTDEFLEVIDLSLTDAMQKIVSGEIEDAKTVSSLLLTINYLNNRS